MIVDLFSGPDGWRTGLAMLGHEGESVGLEWDEAACATANAAGHRSILCDLSMTDVRDLQGMTGLIASPPCQAWSTAGKGLGKLDKPRIMRHVQRIRDAERWVHYSREGWHDPRSPLVLEVLRYALIGRPEWIACEQVPAVLPLWRAFAEILEDEGYAVTCGVISAERYGVPQTRKRAILMAKVHNDAPHHPHGACDSIIRLPRPTHSGYRKGKPSIDEDTLPRWVSMAEALGWGATDRPYVTIAAGTKSGAADPAMVGGSGSRRTINDEQDGERWLYRSNFGKDSTSLTGRNEREADEPAMTMTGKPSHMVYVSGQQARSARRSEDEPAPTVLFGHALNTVRWEAGPDVHMNAAGATGLAPRGMHTPSATITGNRQFGGETIRVSVEEAARLQSFPTGYPWQGTKAKQYEQVGNAIPPLMAAAILGTLLDLPWHDAAHSMRPAPDPILDEFPWLADAA